MEVVNSVFSNMLVYAGQMFKCSQALNTLSHVHCTAQNGVQGKVLWPLLVKSPQLPGFLYTDSCCQPQTFVHVIPSK